MSVLLDHSGAIAVLALDNPPVNALRRSMLTALLAHLDDLAGAEDVAAVLLTSAVAGVFTAGGDVRELLGAAGTEADVAAHVRLTDELFDRLDSLPQPVLAAVDGVAAGGGLELLLCCDIVVASDRSRFGTPEVTLGLIPGAGGTQRLPRRVGPAAALDLLLTGRLVGSDHAWRIGLVTEVVSPDATLVQTQRLAERIARLPPGAVRAAKAAGRAAGHLALDDGLRLERQLFTRLLLGQDARERLAAFARGDRG